MASMVDVTWWIVAFLCGASYCYCENKIVTVVVEKAVDHKNQSMEENVSIDLGSIKFSCIC